MKVKLITSLPQVRNGVLQVRPAGTIIDSAPEAFMEKLVKQGRAVWVDIPAGEQDSPPSPAPLPFSEPKTRRKRRVMEDD